MPECKMYCFISGVVEFELNNSQHQDLSLLKLLR